MHSLVITLVRYSMYWLFVCLCVCVCICVCVCVCMLVYICVCVCVCIHECIWGGCLNGCVFDFLSMWFCCIDSFILNLVALIYAIFNLVALIHAILNLAALIHVILNLAALIHAIHFFFFSFLGWFSPKARRCHRKFTIQTAFFPLPLWCLWGILMIMTMKVLFHSSGDLWKQSYSEQH